MTSRNSFFTRSGGDFFNGYSERKNSVRPDTPDSLSTEDDEKLTRDQHACINNLGMSAAFFLPLCLIAAAVGMGTTYWFNIDTYYVGLFKRCQNWTQVCTAVSGFYNETRFDKVQTTWTIGMPLLFTGVGLLALAMATLVCYPCHRKVNFSKMACAVTVGVILLIGCIVFLAGIGMFSMYAGTNSNDGKPMWSFYCGAAAAVFAFIATVLFWIHVFYTGCFEK